MADGGEADMSEMYRQGLEARRGLDCRLMLQSMRDDIVVARDDEHSGQRRNGVSSMELARLRTTTLDALVAYADALDSLAWPVPRGLLQQIQLRRALLSMPPSPGLAANGAGREA
jgi:hypothetical protein